MKKLMTLSLISFLIAGAYYGASLYLFKAEQSVTQQSAVRPLHVALFTPITHPALEEVERGFKETLVKLNPQQPYLFTTHNANGNRTLLRAQAEEMVQGDYDLLFTMGAMCSQTVAELLRKKSIQTPHVFGAVDGIEIAQAIQACHETSTGVYVQVDYLKEMEILRKLKSNIKNIVLVYDPTHETGLEKYKQELEVYFAKCGVILHSVEIYQTNEIQQKVAALLPHMDVVLVLIDNTVVAGIDALITLCNRYGVTLLASDLASGEKGAALAYGITEYDSGSGAAKVAQAILMHGKKPHDLPISPIMQFQIAINKNTMTAQNLHISDEVVQQYVSVGGNNV